MSISQPAFRSKILVVAAIPLVVLGVLMSRRRPPDDSRPSSAGSGYSNVHPADYVGPDACRECHAEIHALWSKHAHSRMNLNASDETVLGDFSGCRVTYGPAEVLFDKQDGQFRMSIFDHEALVRRYRVTRTVGTRIEQMYIGVQTEGPEPLLDAAYTVEGKLPFGYWLSRKEWLPAVYFDSDCPADYSPDGRLTRPVSRSQQRTTWGQNCIYCHNTYPYVVRLHAGLRNQGFPKQDVKLLRRKEQLSDLFGVQPVRSPLHKKTPFLKPEKLVNLGISCESCHFGGREHVQNGGDMRYVPSSPDVSFAKATDEPYENPQDRPYVINSICSQCHCAGVSQYPNGAATMNSREAFDLLAGGCISAAKCTDCHDPHHADEPRRNRDFSAHVATCVGCHEQFQDADARERHTRHSADDDVSCLDCHMPRIVQGLEEVVSTHLISSPTDERMLSQAAPNACNLCHLDRSIQWTLDELERGWGSTLATDDGWAKAYDESLNNPVGKVWLSHSVPSARLVAADAWSRSPLGREMLPELLKSLNDPIAVNRMFAMFAVERVIGRQLQSDEYTPTGAPGVRTRQVEALAKRLDEL